MKIWKKFIHSLCLSVLIGGIVLSITINAQGGGYDLSEKGHNFGIVNQISAETGRLFAGNLFIVDSGNTLASNNASSGNFKRPYSSIHYANSKCTANNGDLILALAGHTETVTAAGGLVFNVAGVTCAGIGSGSDRPTVNLTTVATADVDITAANVTLYNILFTGGVTAITGVIDVTGTDFSLLNCEIRAVTGVIEDGIQLSSTADRALIDGLVYRGAGTAGPDTAIEMTGDVVTGGPDDVIIRNSYFYDDWDLGAINSITGGPLRTQLHDLFIWTEAAEDLAINLHGTNTGYVGPNIYIRLQDDANNVNNSVIGSDTHFMQPIEIVNANDETSRKIGNTTGSHPITVSND